MQSVRMVKKMCRNLGGVMISSRQISDRTLNFRALFAEFSLTFGRSPRRKNKDRCYLRQFVERLGYDLGLC